MSEKQSMQERIANIEAQHGDAVKALPVTDPSRVQITKSSHSVGDNSAGEVVVFRDSATNFKYTVSVNVSVTSPKLTDKEKAEGVKAVATSADIECFENAVAEFLRNIKNEIA